MEKNKTNLDCGFDLTEIRKILLPESENKEINLTITLSEKTIEDIKMMIRFYLANKPFYEKGNKTDESI